MKKRRLAIYALHPITYQTPIFKALTHTAESKGLDIDVEVLFGDDLSLREVYYEHLNKVVKFDNDLYLEDFPHSFMKNYAKDSRGGFFSRINPSIFFRLLADRYDAILIHGYETFTSWFTLLCAKLLFRKVIFRGEAVLEGNPYKPGVVQRVKRLVLPLFFSLCDAVMYSCQGNKRYFQFFGVQDTKLFLLPCAVNNEYFLSQQEKIRGHESEIRSSLGIGVSEFVVLFSARFTERKRPFDLIDAVAKIGNENITILFVGDGPERRRMEEAVDRAKVKAVFTGFVGPEELSKYYAISNLDVVISSKDPSPKSLNEALIFSLPIIVSDVVGTAFDLVKDRQNGYIVKVGDVSDIAQKVDYLAKNSDVCRQMGAVSFQIVQSWTIQRGAEAILSAFDYSMHR